MVKQYIAVTSFVHCMCMPKCMCGLVLACVCESGFVRAITSTFMHEFQNNLAQLLSLRRSTICNIF